MKRSTLIAVSLLTGIVVAGFFRTSPSYSSGKLEMRPEHVLITDIEEGASRDIQFELINGTDEVMRVKVTASCGCSRPPKDWVVVPPHAAANVPIRVDTKQAPGTSEIRLTAVSEDKRFGARAGMRVRPVPQVVLRDVALTIPAGVGSVETLARFVGERLPTSLRFGVSDDALSVRAKRRSKRVWVIEVRRKSTGTPFSGGFVAVLDGEAEIGRIDVSAPNHAFGHLRMGAASRSVGAEKREWWWLLDRDAVGDVVGPEGTTVEKVRAGSETWLRWTYPQAMVGAPLVARLVVDGAAHRVQAVAR